MTLFLTVCRITPAGCAEKAPPPESKQRRGLPGVPKTAGFIRPKSAEGAGGIYTPAPRQRGCLYCINASPRP